MNEIKKVETFDVMDFLKNLRIPLEDKKKLLLGISAIMVNVGDDSTKMATAACMGLSTNDEKFAAFYNKDIKPVVKLDIQTIYDNLCDKVIDEDEEKLNRTKEFILASDICDKLNLDIDGDIIRTTTEIYYINGSRGIIEKIEEEEK